MGICMTVSGRRPGGPRPAPRTNAPNQFSTVRRFSVAIAKGRCKSYSSRKHADRTGLFDRRLLD